LETARAIYTSFIDGEKIEDPTNAYLELADVLASLGQLALEIESVDTALKDLEQCLDIRCRFLAPNDRLLSESHFYLALAYQANYKYRDSLVELDKAQQVLNSLLDSTSVPEEKKLIIESLKELDQKIVETQRTLAGEDQAEPAEIISTVKEILKPALPQPKPQVTANREIRDMGVFGLGQKRKRIESDNEPDAKHRKTTHPEESTN